MNITYKIPEINTSIDISLLILAETIGKSSSELFRMVGLIIALIVSVGIGLGFFMSRKKSWEI